MLTDRKSKRRPPRKGSGTPEKGGSSLPVQSFTLEQGDLFLKTVFSGQVYEGPIPLRYLQFIETFNKGCCNA